MAANQIAAGAGECILAGGTESMSMVPMMGHVVVAGESAMAQDPNFYLGMGLTAENVAEKFKISREDQDAFAAESHKRASAALENGYFKEEITLLSVVSKKMNPDGSTKQSEFTFAQDEGPRSDTSEAALSKLRAVFKTGGTVTAGNSSQMSDGAAMAVLASEEFVKKHNLTPMARFCGFAAAGVAPEIMGIGPVAAIPKALKQAGIAQKDVQRIELNEAFAAQALAVIRDLGLDPSTTNPTGGAIALGHPLGTTGCKLAATLLYGMRRDKQKYGMVSMCIGTGMGAAGVFELV
jgi:acetyl-CoA acyltransferase